jgi:hypothetical protein
VLEVTEKNIQNGDEGRRLSLETRWELPEGA